MAGVALSWSFAFSNSLEVFIRSLTQTEALFNSIERIVYYTHLPSEAPFSLPDSDRPTLAAARAMSAEEIGRVTAKTGGTDEADVRMHGKTQSCEVSSACSNGRTDKQAAIGQTEMKTMVSEVDKADGADAAHADYASADEDADDIDAYESKQMILWPANGRLVFKDVSFAYREDLPLVLQNFNLSIKQGRRVPACMGSAGKGTRAYTCMYVCTYSRNVCLCMNYLSNYFPATAEVSRRM